MGRIKTLLVKRITHKLMELYGERFTDNFEENQAVVDQLATTPSKKLRNIIAGYATRLVKKGNAEESRPAVIFSNTKDDKIRRDSGKSKEVYW